MGRISPESGNGLQRSGENAAACIQDRSLLGEVKWNENKLKVKKIQGTKLYATKAFTNKRLNYQVKPVTWQTQKKYSGISPFDVPFDVWQASLTHQSDFLGLFTSYITPEASTNYYAHALATPQQVSPLCFSENRLFTSF